MLKIRHMQLSNGLQLRIYLWYNNTRNMQDRVNTPQKTALKASALAGEKNEAYRPRFLSILRFIVRFGGHRDYVAVADQPPFYFR